MSCLFFSPPRTVADFLRETVEVSSATYLVGQFAFGDMPPEAALRSMDLCAREVMPELRAAALQSGLTAA